MEQRTAHRPAQAFLHFAVEICAHGPKAGMDREFVRL